MNALRSSVTAALTASAIAATACTFSSKTAIVDQACDRYFRAFYLKPLECEYGPLPTARADALRVRYRTVCKQRLGLNGSSESTRSLDTCSAKIESLSCGDAIDDHSCDDPGPGALDDDAICASDTQCASTFCNPSPSNPVTLQVNLPCGRCEASIAENNNCGGSVFASCVAGTRCYGGVCTNQGAIAVGDRCSTDPSASPPCVAGTYCAYDDTQSDARYACRARADVGGACLQRSDCKADLTCEEGGVCQPRLAEGATCVPGLSGACAVGLACDPFAQTCKKITWADQGQSCDGSAVLCLAGLCTSGHCPRLVADGAACQPTSADDVVPSTCDEWASCVDGVCKILDPGACH